MQKEADRVYSLIRDATKGGITIEISFDPLYGYSVEMSRNLVSVNATGEADETLLMVLDRALYRLLRDEPK